MKLVRNLLLGKYKQYLADQKRLEECERQLLIARAQSDSLQIDLQRFAAAMNAMQRGDVAKPYAEALGDASAVFMAVIGQHIENRPSCVK